MTVLLAGTISGVTPTRGDGLLRLHVSDQIASVEIATMRNDHLAVWLVEFTREQTVALDLCDLAVGV